MDHRGSKSCFVLLLLKYIKYIVVSNACKRATSRRFFSISNTVRCTLVAGKPVFGRNNKNLI